MCKYTAQEELSIFMAISLSASSQTYVSNKTAIRIFFFRLSVVEHGYAKQVVIAYTDEGLKGSRQSLFTKHSFD